MRALDEMESSAAYGGAAVNRQIRRGSGIAPTVIVSGDDDNPAYGMASDNARDNALVFDMPWDAAGVPETPDSRDRALLRELVYGVTRWKLTLDSIIFSYSKIKKNKITPSILTILRLGVYQIVFLDKIPVSAACNEGVKLAKKYGNEGSVRFVNALLRKIAAVKATSGGAQIIEAAAEAAATYGGTQIFEDAAEPSRSADFDAAEPSRDAVYLSVRYSYPLWLCARWLERYGLDFATAYMDAGNRRPELTIRVNVLRESAESLTEKLRARGFDVKPGRFSKNALIIENPGNFTTAPEFIQGLFSVQDESSMLAVEALNPRPRDKILDMCAAPGGKCCYMAELTGGLADILATDIRPHRLGLMEQNTKRLGLKSINNRVMDAAVYNASLEGAMDKVLLDAPCTGFGVVGKKPEIKWARRQSDIAEITALQAAMLRNAARYVKPGGVVVYSVCTTEPEECGDIVCNFFRDESGYASEEPCEYLPPALWDAAGARSTINPVCGGAHAGIYMYPHVHGADGFYIARIRRTV